jgi:hypothetical protein
MRLFVHSLALVGAGVFFFLSSYYFAASDYLTSSPTWASEVSRGRTECSEDGVTRVSLLYLKRGDTEATEVLGCAEIDSWDKWFWQR